MFVRNTAAENSLENIFLFKRWLSTVSLSLSFENSHCFLGKIQEYFPIVFSLIQNLPSLKLFAIQS